MLVLTSPAKTIDEKSGKNYPHISEPSFATEARKLNRLLKQKSVPDLKGLMHISENLALLNFQRYQSFKRDFNRKTGNPAIFAFRGDVYIGLDVDTFEEADIAFANEHLRILSGMYGILRPLDIMQPYRLEMGTKLSNSEGKDLYAFWGKKLAKHLNKESKKHEYTTILNLASNEYFKAIDKKTLKPRILTANFKEENNGELKFISFNAKKARGMMMRFIVKNRITNPDDITGFDYEGYHFSKSLSSSDELLFIR